MTTHYNIVSYGTLTNTNGVLSNFSASNYATIPLTFNPVQHPYEIVFKVNTGTMPTEGSGTIWQVGDVASYRGHLDIEVWNRKIYIELAADTTLIWSIEGVTTLSSNTDYWVKLIYNGTDTYGLYLSTNGTTWTTEGTTTSSRFLSDGSGTSFIGIQPADGGLGYPWFGSIDLNESYIDINNIRWWQGVTSTSNVQTRIQLRHDTATNWTTVNPILLEGEVGIETDTLKQKVGDGTTAWTSLSYIDGGEIYVAQYGITTYSEITTALANYKTVICKDGSRLYYYIRAVGGYSFGSSFGANAEYIFVDSNNTWSRGSIFLANRDLSNVNSIDSSSAVQTALDEKANTDLSNLSATGKTVIDGQWIITEQDIISTAVSLNGSSDLSYTVNLPNDGHIYEVMIRADANTGNILGNWFIVGVKTNILTNSYVWVCGTATQAARTAGSQGTVIVPMRYGTNNLYLRRNTNYNGSTTLKSLCYRRVGTNA